MSAWPLFDLAVRTPRLELQYTTDAHLDALVAVRADVIEPGTLPMDGDDSLYTPGPEGTRRWLRGRWGAMAKISPEWWVLTFAVVVDGEIVGEQDVTGIDFPLLRSVETYSWLARRLHGTGIGTEIRAAILHLAFDGLGAVRAASEAFVDNEPSTRVSQKLGYEPNGSYIARRRDEAAVMTRHLLTRERWQRRDDIEIVGLDGCRELLGLG